MTNLPQDFMNLKSTVQEPTFQLGEAPRARYYISEFVEWVEGQPVSEEAKERFREIFKGDEYMKASPFDVEMTLETLLLRAHMAREHQALDAEHGAKHSSPEDEAQGRLF